MAPGRDRDEASSEAQEHWHWIKVGSNAVYCAIYAGVVVAILYETAEELGSDAEGKPIITAPGWFWFPTEGSSEHYELVVDTPVPDASTGSLDPVHDAALDVAFDDIQRYLRGEALEAEGE